MDMIWLPHILERDPCLNTWIWTELYSQVLIYYEPKLQKIKPKMRPGDDLKKNNNKPTPLE